MADIKISLVVDSENPNIGDIYLKNGTVELATALIDVVAQELRIRLNFFLGEWFLDATQGIPYFQTILGQKTPIGIVSQIFKKAISTCPGVANVDSFDVSFNGVTRSMTLNFACVLTDGSILKSSDFQPFVIGAIP